jgi:hypothetical protein
MNWPERAIKIPTERFPSKRHVCSRILLACLAILPTTTSWACSNDAVANINSSRSNAILDWNQTLLNAIVATHAPTVAARALAIVHTSAFNAWSAYTADAQSTEKDNPRRRPEDEWTATNKDLAILTMSPVPNTGLGSAVKDLPQARSKSP